MNLEKAVALRPHGLFSELPRDCRKYILHPLGERLCGEYRWGKPVVPWVCGDWQVSGVLSLVTGRRGIARQGVA